MFILKSGDSAYYLEQRYKKFQIPFSVYIFP